MLCHEKLWNIYDIDIVHFDVFFEYQNTSFKTLILIITPKFSIEKTTAKRMDDL